MTYTVLKYIVSAYYVLINKLDYFIPLFIMLTMCQNKLLSYLILYSAGSGVNRVQVIVSGFSVSLFCFVQAKSLYKYGCMYFLAALVLLCVDVMVMSSAYVIT